jgi:hypothetical protein
MGLKSAENAVKFALGCATLRMMLIQNDDSYDDLSKNDEGHRGEII